jgi:hypothetical protein
MTLNVIFNVILSQLAKDLNKKILLRFFANNYECRFIRPSLRMTFSLTQVIIVLGLEQRQEFSEFFLGRKFYEGINNFRIKLNTAIFNQFITGRIN